MWVPTLAHPHLYTMEQSGYFSLTLCQDCGRLWVTSPYEPYAACIYVIQWPYSWAFWSTLISIDDGLPIARWCNYKIRQLWPTLSAQDREAVNNHRTRSYDRNPIDDELTSEDADPLLTYRNAAAQ